MSKASENTLSLDSFSPEAKALVSQAQRYADDRRCRYFDPAHLLVVLLDLPDVMQLLKNLEVNTVAFNSALHGYLPDLSKGSESSSLSPSTIELLKRARLNVSSRPVNAFDLLFALSQEKQGIVGNLVKSFDLTPEKIGSFLNKGQDRDIDSSPYFTNLSLRAKSDKSDVVIGRDNEVRRLIQILGRRSKNHPILVGEHGVGKRTIVLALVNRIINKNVPTNLLDKTVVQLDTANLLSGAKARNEVENRLQNAIKALDGYKVIVYIRSLDTLMVQGLNLNLHDLIGMLTVKNNIQVITSTTPDGMKKLIEKENHLVKELTQLNVEPCSPECAVEVLRGVASRYEQHHNIRIGEKEITTAVKLAKRYVQDRFLPESAIDLIDEAASNKMMQTTGVPLKLDMARSRSQSINAQLEGLNKNDDTMSLGVIATLKKELAALERQIATTPSVSFENGETRLSEENIASVLAEWTNIPVSKFLEGETDKLAKMEERLFQRIVGQNEAVSAVSKSVRRSYTGLRDPGKPIGSFFFLGSSGCGKTEMAKALAEFLFDDESAMVRFDMSEFQQSHMSQRLIGSPPGYQGAEEGGQLTEAVRRKPYSVLLFDEVEKAHPDVFNMLLQVLDDGRLTDGRGRVADFSNTIVIMTSNIGSKKILDADKKVFESETGRAEMKEMLHNELKTFLRPEFINRIDETVVFRPLAKEQLSGILNIQLKRLHQMLGDRQISVKLTDEAKCKLVDISYEPAYGARPLKRAIMKHIQDPLAEAICKAQCSNGAILRVFLHDDKFLIEEITE